MKRIAADLLAQPGASLPRASGDWAGAKAAYRLFDNEALRWIARLGGFLGRKHDGHPGMIVLWRGLQRLHDISTAWQIFTHVGKVVGNA